MLGLEMADHRFNGEPAAHLAFDPGCHTSLLRSCARCFT
jgi:hypothetical protein